MKAAAPQHLILLREEWGRNHIQHPYTNHKLPIKRVGLDGAVWNYMAGFVCVHNRPFSTATCHVYHCMAASGVEEEEVRRGGEGGHHAGNLLIQSLLKIPHTKLQV